MSNNNELAHRILSRMGEVDRNVSCSKYVDPGSGPVTDRPPNGGDYNALWDAILHEICCEFPYQDIRSKLGMITDA